MAGVLIVTLTVLMTILGDYLIKVASDTPNGLLSRNFLFGALLYGLPAVGWFFLMRNHSLAAIGVFYSAGTIILLAALGYFVFKESFGIREALGLALAIASVIVMSSSSS